MRTLLIVPLLTALALSACDTAKAPTSGTAEGTIKIGYIGPLTGEASPYGVDTLHGIQLKVDAINAKGGINGSLVEIIAEDGKCTGTDAASAAQKLVAIDKVVAIIGGQCSSETLAAAPIAEKNNVVMISPLSSSPDVTNAGDFIFRDYPSDALKTKAMAKYFKDNNVKKVAAITENTDFAIAFRDALKAEIGDGLMFDEVVEPGTKDFRTLMTRLQKEDFDMFFPNGQTPAAIAAMMQQLREQGMKQPAISHDVADSLDLISIAGDAVNGMRVISVANAGEGQSFEKIFTEKYGTPSQALGYAAQAYDAMGVLGDALASAGADGKAIRDYLYGMKSYKGVIGNFHFDKNGDVVGVPYVLKVVKGGKFVKEKDIAVQ